MMMGETSQIGMNSTRLGKFRKRGLKRPSSFVYAVTKPAMSSSCIEKGKSVRLRAGMPKESIVNVRAWAKIMAVVNLRDVGTKLMKRSRYLGEFNDMHVASSEQNLRPNNEANTDPHLQQAASPQGLRFGCLQR